DAGTVVTALRFERERGALSLVQTVSTVAASFAGWVGPAHDAGTGDTGCTRPRAPRARSNRKAGAGGASSGRRQARPTPGWNARWRGPDPAATVIAAWGRPPAAGRSPAAGKAPVTAPVLRVPPAAFS